MMIIEIDKLVKRYGDFVALNHFDLQVQEGEVLGLLGPNGREIDRHQLYAFFVKLRNH